MAPRHSNFITENNVDGDGEIRQAELLLYLEPKEFQKANHWILYVQYTKDSAVSPVAWKISPIRLTALNRENLPWVLQLGGQTFAEASNTAKALFSVVAARNQEFEAPSSIPIEEFKSVVAVSSFFVTTEIYFRG